jgi:hypothetical protein
MKPMTENIGSIIPGGSIDPNDDVERYIKAAWGLGGIAVSVGAVTSALNWSGFDFLPANPILLDYARAFAFSIACMNVLCWIWFPLQDFWILRMWVRTNKVVFPIYTSEFLLIVLGTVLLITLIVSSTINALVFGLTGIAIYVVNLIGFAIIRQKVSRAVDDAKINYSTETSVDKRDYLLNALGIIEIHWSCSPKDGTLRNAQQIRHSLLAAAFFVVALFGFSGCVTGKTEFELYAYILGALTILAAEVSIAIWRTSRDKSLIKIFEELRALHSSTRRTQ